MALPLENLDSSSVSSLMPASAKSFNEWYSSTHSRGRPADTNYGIMGDIANFFTGSRDKAEREYDTYLQNLNTENARRSQLLELKATQDARNWDKMMSDTQYQRAVADLKKAGLNPWLAVQSGLSSSSVPSSAKSDTLSGNKYSGSKKEKSSNGLRDVSLLLFALARLAAI